ncbi:hypothetical protein AVEN_60462-1 [Araneus ventricosus]|uniref:Uncharacterized protein n=1 Tax=Araneus ventricosus TaxID=182803 RepID=A0A4Y2KC08_ARAVE|nr:hypothetical protein AVEN_60462-1 [Araneus ventricosus]
MEKEEGVRNRLGGSNLVLDSGAPKKELCDQLGFKVPNLFGLGEQTPRNRQFSEFSAHQIASTPCSLVCHADWKLSTCDELLPLWTTTPLNSNVLEP